VPLGTSARKEGAVVVVDTERKGEVKKHRSRKRDVASTDLERRKR
jgi:hypothetical protein